MSVGCVDGRAAAQRGLELVDVRVGTAGPPWPLELPRLGARNMDESGNSMCRIGASGMRRSPRRSQSVPVLEAHPAEIFISGGLARGGWGPSWSPE